MQSILRGRFLLAATLVVLLVVPAYVHADLATRIVLADGTEFTNAVYDVDRGFKVITITVDGREKTYSFTEIHLIISDKGENITTQVSGIRPARLAKPGDAPSVESTEDAGNGPSGSSAVTSGAVGMSEAAGTDEMSSRGEARRRKRHPFDVSLNLHGSLGLPVGSWFEGFDAGPGFGFDLVVPVGRQVALRGSISKAGVSYDYPSIDVWRYMFGLQYFNWPRWRLDGRTVYNLWTQLGATHHSALGGAVSITKFTSNLGGSVIMMVSDAVGFEFGGNLDLLWIGSVDDEYYYGPYGTNVQTATIIDLRAGFVIVL